MTSDRSAEFEVICRDRLAELPEWDEIADRAGGFYSTQKWLGLYAGSGTRYLVVRRAGQTLAVLPCVVAARAGALPPLTDPASLLGDHAAPALRDSLYPQLHCGMYRGYSNRLLICPALEPALRAAVIARLLEAARELARREGAKLVVFGYLPASAVRELVAIDGRLAPVFAASELAFDNITTFDAYLERVNSHRKNAIRREMRRFAEHGMRIEQRRLVDVVDQVSDVVARHEAKFDPSVTQQEIREAFEEWIGHGYSEISRIFCAYQGDQLVGASVYVVHGATYYARDAAVLPEAPRQAAVYFNISVYHAIAAAAAEGIHRIHGGIGTFGAKVEKGATPTPLWFVFDPGDWDPAALAAMRAAATARLTAEAAELRKHRPDDEVERRLDLAWSLRVLGSAPER